MDQPRRRTPDQGGGAVAGLSGEDFAAWVTASCVRHGVPVKVTDAVVVARTATLLSDGAVRPAAKRTRVVVAGLQAPDGIGPVGVEFTGARRARGDDEMVEHGGHDRVLAAEVELGPLSA